SCWGSPARSKTLARSQTFCRKLRDPLFARGSHCQRDVSGSLRTGADDERTGEVGQTHSAGEVSEQHWKVAEEMEGRGLAKGNLGQQNAFRPLSRNNAPSALAWIRRTANERKEIESSRSNAPC